MTPPPDAPNHRAARRHVLLGCCAGLGIGLFSGLGLPGLARAQPVTDAQGPDLGLPGAGPERWIQPCLGPLPPEWARHPHVQAALEGLEPDRLLDTHAHLLGTGDSGSGCTTHPSLTQWWHPVEVVRRRGILRASCIEPDSASIDRAYVARLVRLAGEFPAGARWWLFAFDRAHTDGGEPDEAHTTFHVPDAYAREVARAHAPRFEWVASIHPYRADAEAALRAAAQGGARAVKWLPSAMNIDLRDRRSLELAARCAELRLPLIVHSGEEVAVPGAGRDAFGNPLHVRSLLDAGATVVMAHCGSLGEAVDEDRRSRPSVPAFSLFGRLMDEAPRRGRLLGDLSAVFQRNRRADVWRAVVATERWHDRLLHGSDHPLPGVLPLLHLPRLIRAGLLEAAVATTVDAVRRHNPLLADLVVKRHLRAGAARLAVGVFEGRALGG